MAELLVDREQNAFDTHFQSNFFDAIASSYGRVNGVASLGMERAMRTALMDGFNNDFTPTNVVDFMCGRGENWAHIREVYPNASITGVDISAQMLQHTQRKKWDSVIHGSITDVPLQDNSTDVITSSFGLKLLDETQAHRLCQEVKRLLRKNGQFVFLELNIHGSHFLQHIARWHMRRVVPLLGGALAKQRRHYRMLHAYCKSFSPTQFDRVLQQQNGLTYSKTEHWSGLIVRYTGSKL